MLMRKSCTYASRARVAVAAPVRFATSRRFASVLNNSTKVPTLRTQATPVSLNVYRIPRRFASYPPHEKLGMPALSPTMTQGNIVKWNKKPGDKIKAGDSIADIETDKSTMSLDAAEDGFLAKILVEEGTKDVPINKAIAILVTKKDDVGKFSDFKEEGGEPKKAPPQAPPPHSKSDTPSPSTSKSSPSQQSQESKPSSPSKSYPPHSVIGLPTLSPSMETGNILAWKVKEGDKIKQGDIIAQIETDKSAMDFETTEDGYIAKLLFPAKTNDLPINTPIAVVVPKKDDVAAFKDFTPQKKQSKQQQQQHQEEQPKQKQSEQQEQRAPQQKQEGKASEGGRVTASPLAKALGREHGVDLSQIRGTGPSNRIIRDDVLEFVAEQKSRPTEKEPERDASAKPSKAPQAAASDNYTDIPVSNIRKVTAERLLLSKQTIPHYYLTMEVRVDKLLKLRAQLNDQSNGKYKLSVNDFIIKASALALQKVPVVNSSWNDKFIRRYNNIDINVAVNTDQGLFTPIVQNADKRGLSDIANAVKVLAEKAKSGKLAPAEFQGGTFTISNLGMFGIKHFAAVINPPQAAILAVGGASQRLVPAEGKNAGASAGDAATEVANVLTVTLSCDHRVIDGAVGAEWLQAFKDVMENPIKLLL